MISRARVVAAASAAVALSSCGIFNTSFNGTPADVYAVAPSQSAVRSFFGDDNWWAGPPQFGVSPLDTEATSVTQRYSVGVDYLHLGSDERLFARYTVHDTTSAASSAMSGFQTAYGTSASGPNVDDQSLYYGIQGTPAAPFAAIAFVRSGQVVLQLEWTRKDSEPSVRQLGKLASLFGSGLKTLNKRHTSPKPVSAKLLPPPGLDITLLGAAQLPLEAYVAMSLDSLPGTVLALLHQDGVSSYTYGDYALNNDPHMEVQTGLLAFGDTTSATDWATTFAPGTPDSNGIANAYISTGNTPAAGVYHYVFSSGQYGVFMVCKSSVEGEAASRECEGPMGRVAVAWKLALQGVGG